MAEALPIIDLAPLQGGDGASLQRLGAELQDALTRFGFFFIRNHGVPWSLVERTFDAAERFHAQPIEAKMAMQFNRHNIGYLPMRGATTRMNALEGVYKPNANEAVFFKRDLPADHPDVIAGKRFRGMNQWPENLPGFRETVLEYSTALERVGVSMLPMFATAFGMAPDFFAPKFRDPMFTLRLTHYPQQDPMTASEEWGLAPHADTSFMTILAQNKVPGLSVRLPGGTWVDAPVLEGCFLVNSGMMLRRWSNDRFLASPHRVTNRSGQERYAIPFFMDATYDAMIEPAPTCVDAEHPAKYAPFTYLDFMTEYTSANYAERQKAQKDVELQGA